MLIHNDTTAELAVELLIHYSFDLSGYTASELMSRWQQRYPDSWVHLAVVEALYQGRYKAISVEQILALWQRRGQAYYHFNMEFERLVCSKFPQKLHSQTSPQVYVNQKTHDLPIAIAPPTQLTPITEEVKTAEKLAKSQEEQTNMDQSTTQESPANSIHSPIGQFTPRTSDRSEVFTSKLKAIVKQED
jgi:hypothetical protein